MVGTNVGWLEPTLVGWNQRWLVGTNVGWLEPTLVQHNVKQALLRLSVNVKA
jgi:hypothetical protein